MKRTAISLFALAAVACGGGEPAADDMATDETTPPAADETAAAPGEMTMPDWYTMDGNNVTLDIVAGQTPQGNYWNYNGYQNGNMTITVPVGAEVTINLSNEDPNMAHSVGIEETYATVPSAPEVSPVFEGAVTSNPTSMTDATASGESETITFTASEAGEYTMVCYIPAHAVSGMWVRFVVSAEGEAGVTTSM